MDTPFTGDFDALVERRAIRVGVTFNRTHYFIDKGQELGQHLYPALASGKIDMVAAMVTVTPEREKLVSFSEPTRTNVSEVVVTGPGAPPLATLDDLSGQEVFVRK